MEGALARLDLWPVPPDVPAEVDMDLWPPALNKKDATAFVRAVRRFGLVERLDAIANECGTIGHTSSAWAKKQTMHVQ